MRDAKYSTETRIGSQSNAQEPIMLVGWNHWMEKIFNILGALTMNNRQKISRRQTQTAEKIRMKSVFANAKKENKITVTQVLQPAYTRRLKPEPVKTSFAETTQQTGRTTAAFIVWHGATDTGMVKPRNEDSFGYLSLEQGTLFVVADGMGGHDAGEVASKMAVDTVCQEVREGVEKNKDPLSLVKHAIQQANAAVKHEGKTRGSNMGTTLCVVFVTGAIAYIANVGDSRVYWVENESITQITVDHSLVAKLTAAGKLTKEEARKHPNSNLLYRTVGTDDAIKVDTFQLGLKKGGNLLLCTDGLWGEVTDENIHRIFVTEKDVKKTCSRLVQMANENGGVDNITALVAKVA